jgi:hypothetical protein
VDGNKRSALRSIIPALATGAALCIAFIAHSSPCKSQSQSSVNQKEYETFKKVLRDYPLSKETLKLEFLFSFPQEGGRAEDVGLWGARYVDSDEDGNLFVSDSRASHILMFDRSGHFIRRIGEKGQGPGEFNMQRGVAHDGERLIVNDTGNHRFQILSKSGAFITSFAVNKTYPEMAAGRNGMIFAAPVRLRESDPLVDAFSMEGKLLFSFGSAKKSKSWQPLNRIKIAVGRDELFIVFTCLPILRTYSYRGELRNESNIGRGFMKEQERMNIARDNEGQPGRTAFIEIIQDIKQDQGKPMVLVAHPRIEILELDVSGRVNKSWGAEKEMGQGEIAFAIDARASSKRFFLLQGYPENIIRVFAKPGINQ